MAPKDARSSAQSASSASRPARTFLTNTSVSAPLNINIFAKPDAVARPPAAPPTFTKTEIETALRAANPHLFVRSTFWSLAYLARDLAGIAALGYAATRIRDAPAAAAAALWPLYWYAQGCVMTGVWVLAHECGHQAFSPSAAVNNSVGWLLHSALLVPYHSWRISHSKHHKNTCSIEHDEVFAPSPHASFKQELMNETPIGTAIQIFVMLVFGW
jgi:omega-6 fatty acid desaturase (delta-12 desaturase)